MKKTILITLFFLIPFISLSQQEDYEKIKLKIIDKGPMAGTIFILKTKKKMIHSLQILKAKL